MTYLKLIKDSSKYLGILGILSQENACLEPPSFLWEINLDFYVCEDASTQKHLIHENKENGIPFWKCFHIASEAHKNMGFLSKNSYKLTTFCVQIFTEKLLLIFIYHADHLIDWKRPGSTESLESLEWPPKEFRIQYARMVKGKVFAIPHCLKMIY